MLLLLEGLDISQRDINITAVWKKGGTARGGWHMSTGKLLLEPRSSSLRTAPSCKAAVLNLQLLPALVLCPLLYPLEGAGSGRTRQ